MTPDTLARYADFMAFADDLAVPLPGGASPLGPRMADFQRRDFAALAPSLSALASGTMPPIRRFWLERTKGASKDTDCTVALLWLLAFAGRAVRMQVIADDQQQASEVRLIVEAILAIDRPLNRLLSQVVRVQRSTIHSDRNGSIVEILTRDDSGSHGARPDLVLANELSHISDEAFASTVVDNADKVPGGIVIVATNAGIVGTWQERWRTLAYESDRWYFSAVTQPAPWISPADLEESRRRNPPIRFRRLWQGQWVADSGEGIPEAWITAAIVAEPFSIGLPPGHCCVVGGVDIGLKHDRTGVVVCAVEMATRKVRTLDSRSWRAWGGGEVNLADVEDHIRQMAAMYHCYEWVLDSWQGAGLRQNLCNRFGLNARDISPVPANLNAIALTVYHGFEQQCFVIPARMEELIADLRKMSIVEKASQQATGFKLVAPRGKDGHGDLASAWCLAATQAQIYSRSLPQRRQPAALMDYPSVGTGCPVIPVDSWGVPIPQAYHPHDTLARQGYDPMSARQIPLPARR